MLLRPNTAPLDMADANTRIQIKLDGYEIDAVDDYEKRIQLQYRKNIVLTYYNYDDSEGGWGSVCEHYVSTQDIQRISDGFHKLLTGQKYRFEYKTVTEETGTPFMMLLCTRNGDIFSFKIWVAEGYLQEWLVITLHELTLKQFNEYADVFKCWARDYPVLSVDELAMAKEIPF